MKYARLGNSDLELSRVVLGTWAIGGWMWGGTDRRDAVRAIQTSLDAGVNTIDTAPMYGFGLSEKIVGEAIRGRREEVVVATKFAMRWDLAEGEYWFDTKGPDGKPVQVFLCTRKRSILQECDRSLKRLGVDVIDLYQCHWPDKTTPADEMMEALFDLRDKGKIREFGMSNYDVPLLRQCLAAGPIASLQPPYNLLQRGIEGEILPFCRENGIGVIVYSPMYRGLLTGKITPEYSFKPGDARPNDAWFRGERLEQVNRVIDTVVRPIAAAHSATPAQVSVAWCLAAPGVTAALVGARTEEQARANAAAADLQLSPGEIETLGSAFSRLTAGG
ncbi:MAG: aldo/keto reductase [Kiritimatiellaeota bacterium]|nr:aldo/keto reductase [Kiritimatiellota bacterium]